MVTIVDELFNAASFAGNEESELLARAAKRIWQKLDKADESIQDLRAENQQLKTLREERPNMQKALHMAEARVDRLRTESSKIKTALAGRTYFHSDAAVEKEMAGLKVKEAKLQSLYHTVNMMMARLGAEGKISTRHTEVLDVMDALYVLDGGVYNQEGR